MNAPNSPPAESVVAAAPAHVITLSCDDRPGIVAAVTTELARLGANITESSQFWDPQTNRFFMRIAFAGPADAMPASL